jgi:tetratricopeptide (TPR) repeat protein
MHKNEIYLILAERHEKDGDLKKACEFYEKSLKFSPSEKVYEKLGLLLKRDEDILGAKEHFINALSLNPKNITCIYNLGVIERIEGKYDCAIEKYMLLKKMGVKNSALDMSLGVLFSELGEPKKALDHYSAAIEKGDCSDILLFNYSLCLMTLGDYREGLRLYERRIWHAKPPGDEWKGESDAELLISPEQGNGDIIQFSRYMSILRKKCKKIIFLCNAPLVKLIRQSLQDIDEVIEFNPGDEFVQVEKDKEGESVPYGKFLRIMSVPYALELNPPDMEFQRYIFPEKERVQDFRKKMSSKKVKVGLCWQGGKRSGPEMMAIDKRRSILLYDMLPLTSNKNAEFYSLQKNDDQNKDFPFIIDLMNESHNFADTAAIVENLDLVITVDTAIAHLAASMGKTTWMFSRRGGCWRWGSEGQSTFWYPSMRIFRQEKMNCWKSTILEASKELKKFVKRLYNNRK